MKSLFLFFLSLLGICIGLRANHEYSIIDDAERQIVAGASAEALLHLEGLLSEIKDEAPVHFIAPEKVVALCRQAWHTQIRASVSSAAFADAALAIQTPPCAVSTRAEATLELEKYVADAEMSRASGLCEQSRYLPAIEAYEVAALRRQRNIEVYLHQAVCRLRFASDLLQQGHALAALDQSLRAFGQTASDTTLHSLAEDQAHSVVTGLIQQNIAQQRWFEAGLILLRVKRSGLDTSQIEASFLIALDEAAKDEAAKENPHEDTKNRSQPLISVDFDFDAAKSHDMLGILRPRLFIEKAQLPINAFFIFEEHPHVWKMQIPAAIKTKNPFFKTSLHSNRKVIVVSSAGESRIPNLTPVDAEWGSQMTLRLNHEFLN